MMNRVHPFNEPHLYYKLKTHASRSLPNAGCFPQVGYRKASIRIYHIPKIQQCLLVYTVTWPKNSICICGMVIHLNSGNPYNGCKSLSNPYEIVLSSPFSIFLVHGPRWIARLLWQRPPSQWAWDFPGRVLLFWNQNSGKGMEILWKSRFECVWNWDIWYTPISSHLNKETHDKPIDFRIF